jgi:hemoglobin
MRRWSPLLALVAACASAGDPGRAGTSSTASAGAAAGPSLYQRLGGRPAIDAVVDTFVANVGRDPRVNVRFLLTDLDALKLHLSEQICEASGGPCKYRGRPMKALHAPMKVRGAEFDAMAEDLAAALKTLGVPARESQEVLTLVASTRADIVDAEAR